MLITVSIGFILLGDYTQKPLWSYGIEETPTEEETEEKIEESLQSSIAEPSWDYMRVVNSWNQTLSGQNVEIVFLGDSITYRGKWAEYFPDLTICNLGVGSDGIQHCYYRIPLVDTLTPEKVFLMCGINNIAAGNSAEDSLPYFEAVLSHFEEMGYETYVQSILPVREPEKSDNAVICEFNRLLVELAEKYNAIFIDLYPDYLDGDGKIDERYVVSDGIHLNEEGYQVWINEIRMYLDPYHQTP